VEAARRRQDASSDAESELQMAKQQGREMVNEARAYRERVLSELSRRREMARQQIEQLVHGRDRLLQAFERARIASVDVMAELTPLGEPSEYVNLAPTTGPVPIMVPAHEVLATPGSRRASGMGADADRTVALEAPELEPHEPEQAGAGPEAVELDEPVEPVDPVELDDAVEPDEPDDDRTHHDDAHDDDAHDDDAHDDHRHDDGGPIAPVVALFAGEVDSSPAPELPRTAAVDDLFAKLRAARTSAVLERVVLDSAAPDEPAAGEPAAAEPVEAVDATEPADGPPPVAAPVAELSVFHASPAAPAEAVELDDSPFGRRDALLTPIIVAAARRLKRVLADEQNDVLHILRGATPATSLAALLPAAEEQVQRYATAVDGDLRAAAMAGADSVAKGTAAAHRKAVERGRAVQPAVELLAGSIVHPLRERLEHAVDDAGGDNGELATFARAIYREWKTQRIDEHLDDVALMAFGRGQLAALAPGTPVCWSVDPNGPACPDAEDNALAGVVAAGDPFPTEHRCAPAHDGCRCMLSLAPR
jgi:hypothetical protein